MALKEAACRLLSLLTLCSASMGVHGQASISPGAVNATIGIGQSITIHNSLRLDTSGATTVDVFFLADNTGSMGTTVATARAGASAILNAFPNSYQYGVGAYFGDPSEPGMTTATSYRQITALTNNKAAVQSGINSWVADGGGDGPEGNYFALRQVATTANWRPEAQRVMVWFGDAPSHTETVTQSQATTALQSINLKMAAFNNGPAETGIDGSYATESITTHQASDIVAALGGGSSLTNNFLSVSNQAFIDAVTRAITGATSSIDLSFLTDLASRGLQLNFTCTDVLGCNNVPGGATRTFDTTITGIAAGTYEFDVFAQGVAAFQHNTITVAVPEPSSWAAMIFGLSVLVAARRRGRAESERLGTV